MRFFTSQRLVQDKDICEKQGNKPEDTGILLVYFDCILHSTFFTPLCLPHAETPNNQVYCPVVTENGNSNTYSHPAMFSTSVPLTLLPKPCKPTDPTWNCSLQRPRVWQVQDPSKSYSRAICILTKIQPETPPEHAPESQMCSH